VSRCACHRSPKSLPNAMKFGDSTAERRHSCRRGAEWTVSPTKMSALRRGDGAADFGLDSSGGFGRLCAVSGPDVRAPMTAHDFGPVWCRFGKPNRQTEIRKTEE
jgi:hypothetical protein